jgi:hypothetical protein
MSFVENGQNADISAVQAGFNLQTKIKIQWKRYFFSQ